MKLFWEMPRLRWNLKFFPVLREVISHDELTQLRQRNLERARIARQSGRNIYREK